MQTDTIIHFDGIWAAYRLEPVLRDIHWRWLENEQWAILGGNGAGKSAIAQLITDQLRPQRGTLNLEPSFAGKTPGSADILHLSFELQRQLIDHDIRFDDSETREDAFDAGTTVRDIVLQRQPQTERFEAISQQCGISHILDRGIRFVSTGESRKTLLARALYQQPKLLILDNPLEGLDQQSQLELKILIDQLLLTPLKVLLLIKQTDEIPNNITHILHLENGLLKSSGARGQVLKSINHSLKQSTVTSAPLPEPIKRDYSAPRDKPLLELQNVGVKYQDQCILSDINWRLDWGQHCCISGPNGAGKSTLLSLICGDNHKAYGQHISLFGQARGSGESIWEIKQKFGIVNTQMQLSHSGRTRVAEVVASGLYDSVGLRQRCEGRERAVALEWLALIGLKDIAKMYFNQLSFGQQRLAMLARAMVKSPLILILDEPCLGLDEQHRQHILALVDQIAQQGDCHILYVSHSANEMPRCINQQLQLIPSPQGGYTGTVTLDL